MSELESLTQPGDIMIGVLLTIHVDKVYKKLSFQERPPRITCTTFGLDYYHQFQAVMFTVQEINKDANILSNVTLGFKIIDTCNIPHYELQGTLQYLTESSVAVPNYRCPSHPPVALIIGSVVSSNSIILADVLGVHRYPQISPLSSVPILSDRIRYPSFFRTIASDKFQSRGLAKLVLHFGWTWVGLLATDNDYGQQGIQPIRQELIKAGVCVAFTEYINLGNIQRLAKVIQESTVKVVIVFSISVDLIRIANEMLKQNVKGKIFIANAGWSMSVFLSFGDFIQIFSGTIGLAIYNTVIPGYSKVLSNIHPSQSFGGNWVKLYWENIFKCQFLKEKNVTGYLETSLKECTGEESLENIKNTSIYISSLKFTYTIHAATHVAAKALDDMRNQPMNKQPSTDGTYIYQWNYTQWKLVPYIKKVRLSLSSGDKNYFDKNGDPPLMYSIVNWQQNVEGTMTQINAGSYDGGSSQFEALQINLSQLRFAMGDKKIPHSVCSESCPPGFRKSTIKGQPVCCFECMPCLQGEIANQTDSINCLKCPWDHWSNAEKNSCLPKPTEFLSFEDPLGITLATISIISSLFPAAIIRLFIQYKDSPIVKANNYSLSCLLLLSLSSCFLCSLVFIGYPQYEKCLLCQVAFGMTFTLCVSCILSKTIMVVVAFKATRPGSSLRQWTKPRVSYMIIFICLLIQLILCITWLSTFPPFPEFNIQSKPGFIIAKCNEGSIIAFWTMLGFLFLLATISFIVAFMARRLPDSFNEAQFITFSMLAFLSVWTAFIPASLSAQGKYTVAMEIFAILASSWALVICMFLPKCFIILFRPDMNSREYIMRKERQ